MHRFDEIINRQQTQSLKWDKLQDVYGVQQTEDLLPMWVADMDFAAPAVMMEAIEKRLAHKVFGYSFVDEELKSAICNWFQRRLGWSIDPQAMLFKQGVVPALAAIIEAFTNPGDTIAICTPIYPPFFKVPAAQQRTIATCNLIEENGDYTLDLSAIEQLFQDGAKLFMLCNPHNPIGIVWRRQQLEELLSLCIQYDVYLVSDEIHADLLFNGPFTPILTVKNSEQAKVISCIAPTKTFNISGIQLAMMVVPNKAMREVLALAATRNAELGPTIFAIDAAKALYSEGDEWLDALLSYLQRNIDYAVAELNQLEGIAVQQPDATYLLWIDTRATDFSEDEWMQALLTNGRLALNAGSQFGTAGNGFFRMNIACPFTIVQEGVARFKHTYQSLKK